MKKGLKRAISTLLSAAMLATSFVAAPTGVAAAGSFSQVGGWFETLYAEWSGNESDVTSVSYSGPTSGTLTGDDLTYLVRQDGSNVRLDIPGLTPGTYTLNVTTASGTMTQSNITVDEYDRSGFAHFNYTEGVGAYNDDGTLKANAKVLYVTNDNKDTVSVTSKDGTTVTGIGNILNSAGKDNGTGTTSKGGVPNTNQGIIGKLAADGTPLVVRIVGDVEAPAGVTAYDSVDYGGSVGDNGYMARMQTGKDITIEGIGDDAIINGWGIHFIADTVGSANGYGKSFETRNISFKNVPEDCLGMEGQQEGTTITAPVERCWIHNCNFYAPSISNPAESDKSGGDGACDFKRGMYFTNSYCYYEGYHKTNLVGSSDSSMQFHLTYHHNYWKNCEARGPLTRQADVHMYNNFYEGQSDYAMNTRANAYIFSEYNLFYMCKNPMRVEAGAIKSYNDSLTGCIGEQGGTIVTDKSQKVSTNCTYANFDTDSSLSYVPSGDYELQTSIADAKKVILAESGTMKANPISPEEVDASIVVSDRKPSGYVTLPYKHSLNNTYVTSTSSTVDNVVFNVGKLNADSLSTATTSDGQDIVFKVNTAVNISVTDGGGTYPVVLMNEYGDEIITGTGSATNVPAGTYVIQSSGFQPGKSGSAAKFKEAKISALNIEAYDPTAPTVTEATTESTTKNPSGGDETTETTTSGSIVDDGYMWHYEGTDTSGNDVAAASSNIFTIDANDTTNDYTYNGVTYASGLKMESSTSIGVNAPANGKLNLVISTSGNTGRKINIDGTEYAVSDGLNTFDLTAGAHTITKNTTNTFIYVMNFVSDSTGEETTEATTTAPTTVATTVATTEATTAAPAETTTKADATTEATTAAPVEGVNISVGTANVKVGSSVVVPVKLTGMTGLSDYTITLAYDSNALTATAVANGDIINDSKATIDSNITTGSVKIAGINPADTINADGTVLVNVTFTGVKEGTTPITLTVNKLKGAGLADVTYTKADGSVTVSGSGSVETSTEATTTTVTEAPSETTTVDYSAKGDVNKDGYVDAKDAALVMKHIQGVDDATFYDADAADANSDGVIDGLDAVWILNNQGKTEKPVTPTTNTYTLVGTDIGTALTADTNVGTDNMFLAKTGVKTSGGGAVQISNSKSIQFKLTSAGTIALTGCISSGAAARTLQISGGNLTAPITLDVEASTGAKVDMADTNLEAGTYTINTVSSSINIDKITVTGTLEQLTPAEESSEATTVATTEATTEATTATQESSETTTAGTASGSWTAGDSAAPSWLDLGALTAVSNSDSYNAFADSNSGAAFTQRINMQDTDTVTLNLANAATVRVFICGASNNAAKGTVTATMNDATVGTYTLPGRKDTAASVFEFTVAQAGTVTLSTSYNAYLFKVEVQ